jgi:hypothetical protein
MKLEEAKIVLTQAIDVAIQKGAFNLNDSAQIIQALQIINELDDVKFGKIKQVEPPKK